MPDRRGTLRDRLRQGEAAGAFWFSLGSPALVELAARAEPDVIVLDVQHGLWSRTTLEHTVGDVGRTCPVLVRVADDSYAAIGAALDSGAEGIIVPMVETPGQAAAVVRAARFPPEGGRSAGGVRPLGGGLEGYIGRARERTVVSVMIETVEAAQRAAEIAATPGLDLVFIGSGDLSIALGDGATAQLDDLCRGILADCRAAGVACGIYTPDASAAAKAAGAGYALVVVTNDLAVTSAGFTAAAGAWADR